MNPAVAAPVCSELKRRRPSRSNPYVRSSNGQNCQNRTICVQLSGQCWWLKWSPRCWESETYQQALLCACL